MAVAAAVACAGCYGSTEAATNVNLSGATLNGFGTTDADTSVFFEYWPSPTPPAGGGDPPQGRPGRRDRAVSPVRPPVGARHRVPASASAAKREGGRPSAPRPGRSACPPRPAMPWSGGAVRLRLPAPGAKRQSSPSGASPTGSLAIRGGVPGHGHGDAGDRQPGRGVREGQAFQGASTFNAEACAEVVDGGPDAPPGRVDYASADFALTDFGQTVGLCTPPPSDAGGGHGGVSVYDAPAG